MYWSLWISWMGRTRVFGEGSREYTEGHEVIKNLMGIIIIYEVHMKIELNLSSYCATYHMDARGDKLHQAVLAHKEPIPKSTEQAKCFI